MIKVLVVDDHESMRESLERLFDTKDGYTVIDGISCADYAIKVCAEKKPDLVFMDVCTEGGASGLKATKDICDAFPQIKIIVMTAFDEVSYAPRAKQAGAHAFIYKSRSLSEFEKIAQEVINGKKCFPEPKKIPMPIGEAPLTDREMEILRLMCRHMTNKEIATELFISEDTVKYHKKNMLAKTGFSKSVDLAFYMILNGWINPLY